MTALVGILENDCSTEEGPDEVSSFPDPLSTDCPVSWLIEWVIDWDDWVVNYPFVYVRICYLPTNWNVRRVVDLVDYFMNTILKSWFNIIELFVFLHFCRPSSWRFFPVYSPCARAAAPPRPTATLFPPFFRACRATITFWSSVLPHKSTLAERSQIWKPNLYERLTLITPYPDSLLLSTDLIVNCVLMVMTFVLFVRTFSRRGSPIPIHCPPTRKKPLTFLKPPFEVSCSLTWFEHSPSSTTRGQLVFPSKDAVFQVISIEYNFIIGISHWFLINEWMN